MQTTYQSVRLFKSDFLEWFSHVHPLTPLIVWGPVAAWMIWHGYSAYNIGVAAILGVGVCGLFTWSLAEYLLHRFVFHFKARGAFQERLVFIMHGIHHADPVDPTRLVMAPSVALVLALIFYPLFKFALGPMWVNPFFGFFLLGYLAYDYTHYAVHHFTPRTQFGKALKQSHMIHHYVNHEVRWGVSSPVWDRVFGTLHEPVPVKRPKFAPAVGLKPGKKAGQTASNLSSISKTV